MLPRRTIMKSQFTKLTVRTGDSGGGLGHLIFRTSGCHIGHKESLVRTFQTSSFVASTSTVFSNFQYAVSKKSASTLRRLNIIALTGFFYTFCLWIVDEITIHDDTVIDIQVNPANITFLAVEEDRY
jgi:hypothetical protein